MKDNNSKNQIEELKVEIARLKKENSLKIGWISLLSHDFKETFSSILILIEALENKSISEADFFSMLPQVKQDTKKNLQTISDTGTWIKMQEHGFKPLLSEIYVFELFIQLKQEFKKNLLEKRLEFTFQGDEAIKINTDRLLIFFILKKIMDNAIKYSHPDGFIFFKVAETHKGATLSITDQGIGMDKNQSETIFSFDSPVFRGTRGEIGAGLSLKIVKNFVYLAHGKIEINSSKNKGTTVSVFLPKIVK